MQKKSQVMSRATYSTHGLHYRVVPPPLRWRGTLGQPKAGGLFLISRNFGLTAGAPCGILEV